MEHTTIPWSYAIVTFDLEVAKIAKQIQIQSYAEFDYCFTPFGQFHTILSLFPSLDKILEGSGAAYLLSEAKIIADDSINTVLKEKSYGHWRQWNLLLLFAKRALHLEKFIEDMDIPSTNLL